MLAAPDIRYTDRDVRENRVLHTIAEEFAKGYGGEFDPLVRAHNMMEMDGGLTVAMARTVLNCMRHSVSDLPEPKGYVMPSYPVKKQVKQEPAKEERESRILYLGANWRNHYTEVEYRSPRLKFDYLINVHKQAKWYHQIDHTQFVLKWYPPDWWDERVRNSFQVQELRAMCGADLSHGLENTKWLGDADDCAEASTQFCPKCAEAVRG
jgi:hypothetical protein